MSQVFDKIANIDSKTISFTMSPVPVEYANVLRRAIQTEVDVLGFRADMTEDGTTSDVVVLKNNTPLSNEMLADRIGLLPIIMPREGEWIKENVKFVLNKKNETDSNVLVSASDFVVTEIVPTSEEPVAVPNTKFFHPDPVTGDTCLIALLKPGEEIHLEAYASMGKGREHARFNPTCVCAYSYTRDQDASRIQTLWQKWLREQKKRDPQEVEKNLEDKGKLEREFRSLEIYRCFLVDAEGEPYSYDFNVESVGSMSVHKIVVLALNAVSKMCVKYASIDTGDLPGNIDIRPVDSKMRGFDVWFSEEDHTLGSLLQTWLDNNKMGQDKLSYVGYKVPHPLRHEMVLRIGVEDGNQLSARRLIAMAAKACADMYAGWATQWQSNGLITPNTTSAPMKVWEAHAAAKAPKKTRTVAVK